MNTVRELTLSAMVAVVLSAVEPLPALSSVDLSVRRPSYEIPATILVGAPGATELRLQVVHLDRYRVTSDLTLAMSNGQLSYDWDATDSQGRQLPAGDYAFTVEVNTPSGVERMVRRYYYGGRSFAAANGARSGSVPLIAYLGPDARSVVGGTSFDAQYRLSRAAHVRVFLTDDSGRTLREIGTGQSSSALGGELKVLCSDAAGVPLKPGVYRVVFSAFANGDKASASLRFTIIAPANAIAGAGVTGGGAASSGSAASPPSTAGHSNNGVRDHGQGEGRDGAGQGKGNGADKGKK